MDALQVIARIHTELPEKFGVPRQSGLVPQLRGRIVFEPAYRNPDAVRGLEDFSHLWLDLAVLRGHPAGLVPYGAAAPSGGQPPHGGLCHPFSLPSQPSGPVLGAAGAGGAE